MELSGTLSNPALPQELDRLAGYKRPLDSRPPRPAAHPRQRPGITVASIVYKTLADATQPMRAKQIHTACEDELGHSVPWSIVQTCLSDHTRGNKPRFTRLGRGLYKLVR